MNRIAIVVLLALGAGSAVAQDKVVLKDGKVVEGKVLSENGNDLRVRTSDETMVIPAWAVERVEKKNSAGADEATPALLEWIDLLIVHLGSEDGGVQQGATLALRAAGAAAHPALEKAAAGENERVAERAETILGMTQRRGPKRERPRKREAPPATMTERILSRLDLDDSQLQKVTEVLESHERRKRDLIASLREGKVPREKTGEQLQALNEKVDGELAEVLTEEQLKRYRELTRPQTR